MYNSLCSIHKSTICSFNTTYLAGLTLLFIIATTLTGCGGSSDPVRGEADLSESKIVYVSHDGYRDGGDSRIYTINPDGSGQKLVIAGPGKSFYDEASFSRDGSKIVFKSDHKGCTGDCRQNNSGSEHPRQIWVVNRDGSQPKKLTSIDGRVRYPSFSQDGSRIIFTYHLNDVATIRVIDANSGEAVTTIQDEGWYYENASLSPDGTKILFCVTVGSDPQQGVYVMNADGTNKTRLNDFGYKPSFSPDGSRILFSARDGAGGNYLMNADGTGRNQITEYGYLNGASFSHDGTKIVFPVLVQDEDTTEGYRNCIIVTNLDGTNGKYVTYDAEPFAGDRGDGVSINAWAVNPTR